MIHCMLEKKFKNPRNKDQIRCGCDGSIRNREKCWGSQCPHFKPTLRHKIWSKLFWWAVVKKIKHDDKKAYKMVERMNKHGRSN